jgi:hypothetical protein
VSVSEPAAADDGASDRASDRASDGASDRAGAAQYRERLWVPWFGWLIVVALAAMVGVAYGAAISALVGWIVFLVVAALSVWGLSVLAIEVTVDIDGLHVGRVFLEAEYLGTATALDRESAVRLRGRDADARAFVVLRAWIKSAVRIDVAGVRDPTPYWFVSTRRPHRLVAAITDAAGWGPRRRSPAPAADAEEEPG